jgi:hypothetical protein
MPDTSEPTATIRHLISIGTTEQELLGAAALRFPELTRQEFVAALQDERQAARRH